MGVLTPKSGFPQPNLSTESDLAHRLHRIERQLRREHAARIAAEAMAERSLRDLHVSQQRLALLQRIADAANAGHSIEKALRFTLEQICDHTGWAFGNVYMCAPHEPHILRFCEVWFASDPDGLFPFVELSRQFSFEAGSGLPGRVLADKAARWVFDVTVDPDFPRAPTARACRLHSAFAFPVLAGADVVAVMEFFAHETVNPDEDLLSIMSQIGTQLGRVIERQRAEDKLIHDALHDPLTGLPNRVLFVDRLASALERHRRDPGASFAAIFIDLDGFKLVNDSLGHAVGDELLVEVAARLRSTLAECEREAARAHASWRATLSRMGGDEFTVLLDHIHDPNIASEIAEHLHDCLRLSHFSNGQEVHTTASMGIAHSHPGYRDVHEVMRDADLAMYEAKAKGRAQTAIFDSALHSRANHRLEIENDLRRAVQQGEFVLHYQPIVALDDRRLTGFEALLRWQRAPDELIYPGEFMAIAEETGLIAFIGNWVLREACANAARWHSRTGERRLAISINISPRQFLQPNFARHVQRALLDSGIAPNSLHLEITEGVAIKEPEQTRRILEQLKGWGVGISLDDFGTGYSSLNYLHRFPFDTLKIDRSFVSRLGQPDESGGIVQAVLDLGRNLEMVVVAEGVETGEQAATLMDMGCRYGQGYLFGRPMDGDAAALLVSQRFPPPC